MYLISASDGTGGHYTIGAPTEAQARALLAELSLPAYLAELQRQEKPRIVLTDPYLVGYTELPPTPR